VKDSLLICFFVLFSGLTILTQTGCETERTSEAEITVNPPAATVSRGQSVEFVASGWHGYRWSLSQPEWGVLSHTTGDRTVYTSIYKPSGDTNASGGRALQILTCQGIARTNVSVADTNTVITSSSAPKVEVIITHI